MVLQQVLETVTGTALDEWASRQVFGPLAMRDSAMQWRETLTDKAVPGHTRRGVAHAARFAKPMAAASLYTTAHDYARFLAALLADDALLSLTLTRPVQAESRLLLQWGLGWGIESSNDGPVLWHWGNNPGYRAFAMASTTTGDGFVLLTNGERGLALAEPLAGAVLPGPHRLFGFHMLG
jgi:CubicO group peptidase (beta-lactamase class C family)